MFVVVTEEGALKQVRITEAVRVEFDAKTGWVTMVTFEGQRAVELQYVIACKEVKVPSEPIIKDEKQAVRDWLDNRIAEGNMPTSTMSFDEKRALADVSNMLDGWELNR